MYRASKPAALAGLLLALVGLVLSITHFGSSLEEHLGLSLLFRLRGPRPVPSNVVVITLDQKSAEALGLPSNPLKWPRNLHAKLIDTLAEAKVSVVAYDVLFSEPSSGADDDLLAYSLKRAGNVILCEHLRKETIAVTKEIFPFETLHAEKTIPPAEPLANSAAALAPFPLPKIPMRVSQYWTFKTEAGCKPTLPFLAFQVFSLDVLGDFRLLLESVSPAHCGILPENAETVLAERNVGKLAARIREIFEENPWIGNEMQNRLRGQSAGEPENTKLVRAIIKAYMTRDSAFLNFYGPPGTVPTISFHRMLNPDKTQGLPDLRGKAVFVGLSELTVGDQRDGFNTVFSRSDGTDLSGVEIAATAFANLLEDMPVRPAPQGVFMSICLVWGFIAGYVCFRLPLPVSMAIMAAVAVAYTAIAEIVFRQAGTWVPIAVPFGVQAPLALLTGFSWKHRMAKKERLQIRKAFGFFLPDKAVDQIIDDMRGAKGIVQSHQMLLGTVLCSDGAQYTSLSERIGPEELNKFLNRYYEAIFQPVRAHGGTVSDVIGDSMLAIWATAHQDSNLKRCACRAALDIIKAIENFNRNSYPYHLHTRIGLHHGQLLLGTVGGIDHFEYRPVGDVVNTASRLESLNKLFGTWILASEEVVGSNPDFLIRELGRFLLYGKTNPIVIFELICPAENALQSQKDASALFSEALRSFGKSAWDEAETLFNEYLKVSVEDKLSRFYLSRCEIYRKNPPGDTWDGTISLDIK